MDPKRICVIKKWLTPRNILKVLFFLGFANFYCKFIKEYSKITITLISLIKKDIK